MNEIEESETTEHHPAKGFILLIIISVLVAGGVFWLVTSVTITSSSACYNKTINVTDTVYGKDMVGVLDTDGNGYISRNLVIASPGNTYNITYCVYNNTGDRVVTVISPNPYKCVKTNGVCK